MKHDGARAGSLVLLFALKIYHNWTNIAELLLYFV